MRASEAFSLALLTVVACAPRVQTGERPLPPATPAAAPAPTAAPSPAEEALARVRAAEPAAQRDLAWQALAELTRGRVPAQLTAALTRIAAVAEPDRPMFFMNDIQEPAVRSLLDTACGAGEKVIGDVAAAPPVEKVPALWTACRPERAGLPPVDRVTPLHIPALAAVLLTFATADHGGLQPAERELVAILLAP